MNRNLSYTLYLAALLLCTAAIGAAIVRHYTAPVLSDMRSETYENDPQRLMQKTSHEPFGYGLAPNQKAEQSNVVYSTNSHGLRDREYPLQRKPGTVRVAMVGDSFTFGYGLPLKATFVKQLEVLLNARGDDCIWEVINFGVPGYGPLDEVNQVRDLVLSFSPDIIVLTYHPNDAGFYQPTGLGDAATNHRLIHDFFAGTLAPEDEQRVRNFLELSGNPTVKEFAGIEALNTLSGRDLDYVLNHMLPLYWTPFQSLMQELSQHAGTHNINVLVTLLPELDLLGENYSLLPLHQRVAAEMQRHRFQVVDMLPEFQRHPVPSLKLFGTDGHTSELANGRIAAALAQALSSGHCQRLR